MLVITFSITNPSTDDRLYALEQLFRVTDENCQRNRETKVLRNESDRRVNTLFYKPQGTIRDTHSQRTDRIRDSEDRSYLHRYRLR